MQRVLITGGSGFVGQWLARALAERGAEVTSGSTGGTPLSPTLPPAIADAIRWVDLDVTDGPQVRAVVADVRPDWIIHLAGIAFPPEANADPARACSVNVLGAVHVLTAATAVIPQARVLVVGSADQYGPQPATAYPLAESVSLIPRSFYGSSKAAQEVFALQAWRGSGMHVVCTRSFNHSGVGHASSYLLPSLVERALALPGRGGTLAIGNPEPVRDYLHVSDVVEAYIRLLERGTAGEVYNVCSGVGISVRQLAERVLARAGRTAEIVPDATLMRPSDTPLLIGDNRKLRAATGWSPARSIDDIIDDLIHASAR